ncbi:MAG: UDP-N-acetylmuramate dehydrogenase [Gammaproteobacteria bacterium]|nr:UDP-N-acetylmuramate dehydrogenase [Gammaproteobacteria bacterium]
MSRIRRSVSLRLANSLRVESVAEEYVEARDASDLCAVLDRARRDSVAVTLLGGGTNVVPLRRIEGRVVRLASRGISFRRGRGGVRVTAAAGESWHRLVRECLGRGLAGLENLALIPGTVGAAPIQNIGAYGRELARWVSGVSVVDTGSLERSVLDPRACAFRYRDSVFKSDEPGRYVVTAVTLDLGDDPPDAGYAELARELRRLGREPSPVWVAEAVIRLRRRKLPDPRTVGNAGSFFKNPTLTPAAFDRLRGRVDIAGFPDGERVRVPAARLIDVCGWKGYRDGDAGVWSRHALVLVNHGRAGGREILDLAHRIRDDVARRFDIELDLEPAVLGRE